MTNNKIEFDYTTYTNIDELTTADKLLLQTAQQATANAYAPYSKFYVAATARLSNGILVSSTNQENSSYPIGICAERTLLSTIAAIHPNIAIDSIAISYYNHIANSSNVPISPCGMCRQAMLEWEKRQNKTFSLLLGGHTGIIYKIDNVGTLLPLSFFEKF